MDLGPRERECLTLREAGSTFRAIGERLGVSPERVRQIVDQAEKKVFVSGTKAQLGSARFRSRELDRTLRVAICIRNQLLP